MALESATWISELVITNPPGTDKKKQGDDHLRLLKAVLQNVFPNAAKAFRFPDTVAKSANYGVLSTDNNKTIVCDTTVAFNLTLPVLAVGDAGWCIYVLKTTADANPVFLVPPSGTINGFSKIRRSIAHVTCKVLWTGSVFVATRPNGVPIGTSLPFHGTTLPQGHLFDDGGTFTAADFVELNSVLGGNTKPDVRGRAFAGKDNMGGVSANRITLFDGDVLGNTGGLETATLTQANLPAASLVVDIPAGQGNHQHFSTGAASSQAVQTSGANFLTNLNGVLNQATSFSTLPAMAGTAALGGSGTGHSNLQPTFIANYILVAE